MLECENVYYIKAHKNVRISNINWYYFKALRLDLICRHDTIFYKKDLTISYKGKIMIWKQGGKYD